MAKRAKKRKGLGISMCCEICNNCTVNDEGQYICNQKKVIDDFMPTKDYFWCGGEMYIRKQADND